MIVVELFKFCVAVVFTFGFADASRADVSVAMLVILVMRVMLVEEELGVDCVGLDVGVVVVGVWCYL